MIAAIVLSASAISGAVALEEIDAEARFCLGLPARPDAFEDLLWLRERNGWKLESAVKNDFGGETFDVRVYQANDRTVSTAFASKDDQAFCRYSVSVSPDDVRPAINAVRDIYLERTAVMTVNPYEFTAGVGERVVVETIAQSEEATVLQFTVSTPRQTTPF